MASRTPARPKSPHLFAGFLKLHYAWGPHMLVSILHRATGTVMATLGTVMLVWWLAALAGGAESYATFRDVFTTSAGHLNIIGWLVGVMLSWAFFTHMLNGIRHLVMDAGAAFELKRNKMFSLVVLVGGIALTAAFWLYQGIK
ncbi:succinate dehydrogenase, cytochrome b556 subunit [Sphingomonas sp. MA1305]|uniref:succinate dehydrogenase, cytochrome b556 subunit n=1 Tax=Sphingomonas sp. MA1305 TaxID=2479204 RepID=UPI0018DEF701|nr:succinate dehydrogenase, cytochrome b556 subunit [Sphingomonas sp. MA1305]MBI0476484.1 succinate dehydrogenase, cytochrome b556 subunit [Sphingomonas sp. MA1305]